MKAKFIYEVLRAEDDWANLEIDNYLSKKTKYPLQKYLNGVVDQIWRKLNKNMSYQQLYDIDITKETVYDIITENDPDVKHVFSKSVYDFYEEEKGFIEAAEYLYSEFFAPFIEHPKDL